MFLNLSISSCELDSDAPTRLLLAAPQSPSVLAVDVQLRPFATAAIAVRFLEGAGQLAPLSHLNENSARLLIDPPADPTQDDRVVALLSLNDHSDLLIELRRTRCELETGLLGGPPGEILTPDTRAALLWYGWRRCSKLVGIKRFGSGLSGSDVMVFRPRLCTPEIQSTKHEMGDFLSCTSPDLLGETWGSWLLVKSGKLSQIRQEWARYDVFLRDRLTPFMARSEAFLRVHGVGESPSRSWKNVSPEPGETDSRQATLVSSFVGGDLIRAEPLELLFKGGHDTNDCKQMIGRVYDTLAAWHGHGPVMKLGKYPRFFSFASGKLELFNRYDFNHKGDRLNYSRLVSWDTLFQSHEHLQKHLWGAKNDGLLFKLMEVDVRFSLTHGDLNPRNVLCDRGYVWLIDFEHAGLGPTLHDFAWLEANLRSSCLRLVLGPENLDDAATSFERHLLDHFWGGEQSLEPLRELAGPMGADTDELMKIAASIAEIRRAARSYCLERYPDHRDYLAILYLVVLSLLRGDRESPPQPGNMRLLGQLAWVLEEKLSHLMDRKFDKPWRPLELRCLIDKSWLQSPGAPGRLHALIESADGVKILGPLAACRGVIQGEYHHLNVYEHTLLVLAFIEELLQLDDILDGLLNPAQLDHSVHQSLARQGLKFLPPLTGVPETVDVHSLPSAVVTDARQALREGLNDESRLLLKWLALLHDLGKPGVRQCAASGDQTEIHFRGHPEYGVALLRPHLDAWFHSTSLGEGKLSEADRIRYLILRHHDHNNLAKLDSPLYLRLTDLARFVADPTGSSPEEGIRPLDYFDSRWRFVEEVLFRDGAPATREPGQEPPPVVRELRHDLPLLIVHGLADSLASRGPKCPLSIEERVRVYLVLLAAWQQKDQLCGLAGQRAHCNAIVTRGCNPELHLRLEELVRSAPKHAAQQIWKRRGVLEQWAWEQTLHTGHSPSPGDVLAEYDRRFAPDDSNGDAVR